MAIQQEKSLRIIRAKWKNKKLIGKTKCTERDPNDLQANFTHEMQEAQKQGEISKQMRQMEGFGQLYEN